jgi:cytoskeletal protein CcmA (bactofilin family)
MSTSHQKSWVILIAFLAFLWISMFMVVQPVQATVIDDDGNLAANETINDDLFITGNNVIVDGTVNGTVIAAGNRVVVNGTINGDLFMFGTDVILSEGGKVSGNLFSAARYVEVRGNVGGSVFGGSAGITIGNNAKIGRNVYYGGYSFESMAGSSVNTDAFLGVYQAILNGDIKRNVRVSAGALEINGSIGGDVVAEVSSPESGDSGSWFITMQPALPPAIRPGLRISPQAVIGGDLKYTSPSDQSSAIQGRPAGQIIYQTPVPSETDQKPSTAQPPRGFFALPIVKTVINLLRNLITLLLLGGLALWLIPNPFQRMVDEANRQPLASTGVGLLSLLGGYAGAVLAGAVIFGVGILLSLVTLGGLSTAIFGIGFSGLAVFMAGFSLLVVYGSKLVASFWIGQLLVRQIAPQAQNPRLWALLSGILIYVILRAIPVFGWIIGLLATLIGLGAIWFAFQSSRKPALPTAEETPA